MDQLSANLDSASVLEQDVGCPGCGYNLRGLGSDVVDCPECGLRNDVAVLLVRRWDKPWYRAPRYSLLCMPAATAFLAFLGWLLSIAVIDTDLTHLTHSMAAAAWLGIGLLGWVAAMAWVWNKLDQHLSAGFALLVHLSIVGYVGGLIFTLFGAGTLIAVIIDGKDGFVDSDPLSLAVYALMLIGGAAAIFVGRLIERIGAQHCIRLYLRRPTTSD